MPRMHSRPGWLSGEWGWQEIYEALTEDDRAWLWRVWAPTEGQDWVPDLTPDPGLLSWVTSEGIR